MISGKKRSFAKLIKSPKNNFIVKEDSELMVFLIQTLTGKSRDNIKSLLKRKLVEVDGKIETKFNFPLKKGAKVVILPKSGNANQKNYRGLEIVFEDNDILIANKEAGLLTIATDKESKRTAYHILSEHVKKAAPGNKIFIVHRLDRETSGLILFAKSQTMQRILQEKWNERILERTYIAIVEGKLENREGVYTSYLTESTKSMKVHSTPTATKNGKKAITHYKVIKEKPKFSMLEVNLETGRKNQIRVHFEDMKHPIVGDKKYGSSVNLFDRLALHAKTLAFNHPRTNAVIKYEAEIPKSFIKFFNK